MKLYTKNEIKTITFGLENLENVVIPKKCFKDLKITTFEDKCEVEAHILDDGSVDGYIFDTKSPLQRLNYYNDITHIYIILDDGDELTYKPIWCDEDYNGENNKYQKTKLFNYKEIKLSINKRNKKLSIKEVLKLQNGTIVVDKYNNEYCVGIDKNKNKCLVNTYVTDKIIYSKFIIKE